MSIPLWLLLQSNIVLDIALKREDAEVVRVDVESRNILDNIEALGSSFGE